ncbi:hypothetical protein WJX82_004816 [Trebouxia sp. C0006]
MDCTKHTHPDIDTVRSIKLARHDVHAKLAQLYRLIPLAISCIYEVTGTRDTFMPEVVEMASDAADTNHRMLALQLQDHLKILQQTPLLIISLNDAANVAQRDNIMRQTVGHLKSSKYAELYVGQLRHAGTSLFAGYGPRQSGNCLFWLFEEPERNAEVATASEMKMFGTSIIEEGADENLSGHIADEHQSIAAEEERQGRGEDRPPGSGPPAELSCCQLQLFQQGSWWGATPAACMQWIA